MNAALALRHPRPADDGGSGALRIHQLGLVKVDDVLLCLDAATSGEEIVSWPAHEWVIAKRAESLGD